MWWGYEILLVQIGGDVTRYSECITSTKQGCVSSAITISLFINDMLAYLNDKCVGSSFMSNDNDEVFVFM